MDRLNAAHQFDGRIVYGEIIPAREYTSFTMNRGQVLRIIDLEGQQVADVICFNRDDPTEKLHNARGVRLNGTYKPTVGHVLYSDECNPMFTIVTDTLGENFFGDSMCSDEMNFVRYGIRGTRNCRDNLTMAVKGWDITKKQLPGAFAPFMSVSFTPEGRTAITDATSRPGDYVDLRAEMNSARGNFKLPARSEPMQRF